jgi:hypothetical protein
MAIHAQAKLDPHWENEKGKAMLEKGALESKHGEVMEDLCEINFILPIFERSRAPAWAPIRTHAPARTRTHPREANQTVSFGGTRRLF